MRITEAMERVLAESGKPLTAAEITDLVLQNGYWTTKGNTPEATIHAQIATDIKSRGEASRFQRTAKGVFALRRWGMPEFTRRQPALPGISPSSETPSPSSYLSFTEAAEAVLKQVTDRQPMHYREITTQALRLGLLKTEGRTPESTMYAQILTEIERLQRRGDTPRFVKHGKGLVGLTRWLDTGLVAQIEQHNATVREQLLDNLHAMDPGDFEDLIGALLVKMGFENVIVTARSKDGGIDVRGTLVVGDVVRTNMAVQVKRWKHNVQRPTVQQLRGALGVHDQGLIVTTSDFSDQAKIEAKLKDRVPVALMGGEQLVSLLVEHELGVHRTSYELIQINAPEGS